jgi:hypothetical protein
MGVITMAVPQRVASQEVVLEGWSDIATIYNRGDRFRYDGDYGIRGGVSGLDFTQAYVRPSVRWRPRSWLLLHAGAAWFQTFFENGEDVAELRPWAGVRLVGPRPGGFTISNYFRLEQRMFHVMGVSGWDAVWRGRWQIQITTPDFTIGSVRQLYALTSLEPFDNLGTSIGENLGVDRIRYVLAVGKKIGQGWRTEFHYLFQAIRVSDDSGNFDISNHVLRLRLFYTIN